MGTCHVGSHDNTAYSNYSDLAFFNPFTKNTPWFQFKVLEAALHIHARTMVDLDRRSLPD